ncbi:MAG TPA: putative porin [Rhodopseudomonas sp.]|uniref:putative porin n=1 Tax=Rhodopseudomonas sp. TaxID=1078 RepID=UPI002EDA92E3
MLTMRRDASRRLPPLAVSLCALVCAAPAFGQSATDRSPTEKTSVAKPARVSQAKPSSPNATINLVNMLVKQGVLTDDQAQALIKQAEDEAYVARQAAKDANAKADDASRTATAAAAAAQPPGTRHVTYVPEIVKRQLREEIKQEVMVKAQRENWASPGLYPEWAQRIRFYGDFRARYEGDFFPSGNGPLVNFNAINTGSPFLDDGSVVNPYFPPTYNTTQNRERFRFRARLGMDAELFDGFSAGLRVASGENSSPVSTNQTLGSSASGGDFSKYAVWIDRAFLKYQTFGDDLTLSVGRFDNPFWSPTDLAWYKDLGFDGFAVQARREVYAGVTPFAVAGAFPIYNTDLNAGLNSIDQTLAAPVKVPSQDKWLFGGQLGVASRFEEASSLRFAVAYYDFSNVKGRLSSQCLVYGTSEVCDTDLFRPSFAQKGNTYMRLRSIPSFDSAAQALPNYQYYGLAADYRPVVASGQLDFGDFHPIHVVLDGEYMWNTAFKRDAVKAIAVNNFAGTVDGSVGPFNGGDQGWLGRVTVGHKEIRHLWDWNVHAGYKYLESDATMDAFVDSDFGLGGTNLKGYFLGGNVGLGENVWATLRWMSANNIAGTPYAVDVLQVDLNARF